MTLATRPNITERAMLVDLTIHSWTATKFDKKISDEVAQQHGADSSMGWYNKALVSKDALEKIRRIANEASAEHRRRTLPWLDTGARILSAHGYFDYQEAMRRIEREFQQAVDEFCRNYPDYIDAAQRTHGTAFNRDDYPSPEVMRGKFACGRNVFPLPSKADFRVDLGEFEVARVQADIEEATEAALKDAMRSVADRIREVVAHMAERLRAYTVSAEGTKGTFRDTLVSNVRDLVELLPALNITDDPQLDAIRQEMSEYLCLHEADTLRVSQDAREVTAAAAEAILAKMSEFVA